MDVPLEYVAFGTWCFAVAVAGGMAGLVLGNLRLPVSLLLASSPAAGAGANIAISGVAAGTASVAHVRAGRIDWSIVGWMAPPSIGGALAGGYMSEALPEDALLLGIAAILLLGAVDLLRPKRAGGRRGGRDRTHALTAHRRHAVLVATGGAIGLLGGIVGLILGSLRLPALLRIAGEDPMRLVGSNSVVGLAVGVAGALGHLPGVAPDLGLVLVGVTSSIPGAFLGARLTGRLSERALLRTVGLLLIVAAIGVIVRVLS